MPRHPPATRAQFEEWGKVWPLVFHQAAAEHALAPWAAGGDPPPEELEWMATQMRRAIALAEASLAAGGRPVGAVIARPLGRVLAACPDGPVLGPRLGLSPEHGSGVGCTASTQRDGGGGNGEGRGREDSEGCSQLDGAGGARGAAYAARSHDRGDSGDGGWGGAHPIEGLG